MKVFFVVWLLLVIFVVGPAFGDVRYVQRDARFALAEPTGEMPLMLAQAGSGQGSFRASGAGQSVQVAADYGFGSDITALFRPSRWRGPFRPGGVISWLNPGAWRVAPYRTITVLVGELLFIGTSAAVVEAFSSDDSGGGSSEPAPEPTPAPRPSGGGSSTPAPAATPAPSSDGGGGGSAPAPAPKEELAEEVVEGF